MSNSMGFGRWTVCTILLALVEPLLLYATVVAAQKDSPPSTPPVAIATKVEKAPDLDGEVLEDPAWASAKPASRFWQNTPDEGQPASERTEVRVIYTLDTIYFGVVCYDRDPDSIIVTDSLRDSSLDETDSFQIIVDTYLDRQNGFVFGTNPAAIEYDGQVVNEGEGGFGRRSGARNPRQTTQAGSGGGFNLNWDGSWEVRTRISEIGWSAEFAIPMRTLRFAGESPQTWG
ncbi:MAG: carbohydrate binding family 9 domain-containing protein, partial [Acidobacteriota bacterium]